MNALPCDEDVLDEVFFFCDQQTVINQEVRRKESLKGTCTEDDDDDDSSSDNSSRKAIRRDEKSAKQKEGNANAQDKKQNKTTSESTPVRYNFRLNHIGQVAKKHIPLPKNLRNPFSKSQKNFVAYEHRTAKNSFGQSQNYYSRKSATQVAHTTLVDIQVEDCRQNAIAEKSTSSFSNTSSDNNSIESTLGSQCTENNKQYCTKISTREIIAKGKRCEEHDTQSSNEKSTILKEEFLWGLDKSSKDEGRKDPMKKKSKSKRMICSPLKKFGRSSLSLEPDKIMINLPKCSPCACRLAASSKILSNDTGILSRFTINRDSPLHIVRSKSPSHLGAHTEVTSKSSEKTSVEVNLFSNTQQPEETRCTPRSKSVGELCNIVHK